MNSRENAIKDNTKSDLLAELDDRVVTVIVLSTDDQQRSKDIQTKAKGQASSVKRRVRSSVSCCERVGLVHFNIPGKDIAWHRCA